MGYGRAAPSSIPFPVAHHENELAPSHLMCSVIPPACLPQQHAARSPEAIHQVNRAHFFRESPAKIPTACSGCISDQLPFHLSPPAFEKLRNDSLADTVVFSLLLNAYSCLSAERYRNYCKYTHTPRHPHTSAGDTFARRHVDWMGEKRAGDCGNYSE